jgi:hypothetical protein
MWRNFGQAVQNWSVDDIHNMEMYNEEEQKNGEWTNKVTSQYDIHPSYSNKLTGQWDSHQSYSNKVTSH